LLLARVEGVVFRTQPSVRMVKLDTLVAVAVAQAHWRMEIIYQ
jgi:hypothetical protein